MPRLSKDQVDARRLGLGASDIAEMLGISPYQGASPLRLWAEKRGLLEGEPDEEEGIEKRVGHAVEPALVQLYVEESGWPAKLSGEFVESIVDAEHAWMRCNLDGRVIGQPIGLEIKHVGIGMHDGWDLMSDDGIPHYVRAQCCWQMRVAALDEVHVIALIAGRFRVFYVRRDLELEAGIVAVASKFWTMVVSGERPPLDASAAASALLEKLYPMPPAPVRADADEEIAALMTARISAADAEARMGQRKEIINNQIKEWLGVRGATDVVGPEAKARWRQNKAGNRPLRVDPRGDAKKPRIAKPNVHTIPELIDIDGPF